MGKKLNILYTLMSLLLILFVTVPTAVEAHTSLVSTSPEANSELTEQPENIKLTFSSQIAPNLSSVTIVDEQGKEIRNTNETISNDQKSILLELPKLQSGSYNVSYEVVSTDGHPVEGSYSFSLTVPEPPKKEETGHTNEGTKQDDSTATNKTSENEKSTNEEGTTTKDNSTSKDDSVMRESASETPTQVLNADEAQHDHPTSTYLIRLLYYISILALAGWVFWGIASSVLTSSAKASYVKGSKLLRYLAIIILLGYGYLQFNSLITGIGDLQSFLFATPFGFAWLLMFIITILGFFILHRSRIIDSFWILLLLFGEVLSGHAISFEPLVITTALDMIHLIAAAVWVGGLLMIVSFWKNHREFVKAILPTFSKYALVSIVVLTITGTIMTVIFLPDLALLFETLWGRVLLLKVFLVLMVVILATVIRKKWRKKGDSKIKSLIEWDFGLMIGIVLLVSILTFISPKPEFNVTDNSTTLDTVNNQHELD